MAERRRVACPGRSLSAKGNFGFGFVIFSSADEDGDGGWMEAPFGKRWN